MHGNLSQLGNGASKGRRTKMTKDDSPRYLVPFQPKGIPHHFTDVLIIGGGLAGLRAANAIDSTQSVLVVTKENLRQSNSNYAQGGIAGVIDPGGSVRKPRGRHAYRRRQALRSGSRGNGRPRSARANSRTGQPGARISIRKPANCVGPEGGHSHDRIVHALGDATGKEVMRAVIDHTAALPNVETWENTFTIDLLTHDGACRGALVWNAAHGKTLVWAKQTILCTGGCGQVLSRNDQSRQWPPATAWPSPAAPAPNCATWSSCSSIPRCCTSPAPAAT